MFELIEKLRQKPDRTKKQIASVISLLLSGIIFVVWLSVIYPNFKQNQKQEIKARENSEGPLSGISQTVSGGVGSIRNQFSKMKEMISSFSTAPAYFISTSTKSSATSSNEEI